MRLLLTIVALAGCSAPAGPPPMEPPPPRTVAPPPAPPVQAQGQARQAAGPHASSASHEEALERIALAIERLKGSYPQLADFSVSQHLDRGGLTISYGYHTHRSRRRGGWTAGVPNPDPDGVWLHIDFHDPGSTAQIHTQPVVPELRYRDKRVMFLILEGERTRRLAGALDRILRDEGVRPPRR